MTTPFQKSRQNLRVSIDLDDQLTWGELFQFVELARRGGVDPNDPVGLQYSDHDTSILDAMYVYVQQVDPGDGRQ